ncbi:hypothetical protein BC834DRAFT_845385 [Gloeopeniophorella convolvens]|nr:hypothetical protein BC834DRAFT_845385 [Gloeopeniophorella convolvens]
MPARLVNVTEPAYLVPEDLVSWVYTVLQGFEPGVFCRLDAILSTADLTDTVVYRCSSTAEAVDLFRLSLREALRERLRAHWEAKVVADLLAASLTVHEPGPVAPTPRDPRAPPLTPTQRPRRGPSKAAAPPAATPLPSSAPALVLRMPPTTRQHKPRDEFPASETQPPPTSWTPPLGAPRSWRPEISWPKKGCWDTGEELFGNRGRSYCQTYEGALSLWHDRYEASRRLAVSDG